MKYYMKSFVSRVMAVGELRSADVEPDTPVLPATVTPNEKPLKRKS